MQTDINLNFFLKKFRKRFSIRKKASFSSIVSTHQSQNISWIFGYCAINIGILPVVEAVISKEVFFEQQPDTYENPRTVVISDPKLEIQKTHSEFLKGFKERNHQLTFEKMDDKNRSDFYRIRNIRK